MTKLVVAIAVGICMGGFSALSVGAEEPEAPDVSLTAAEAETYLNPDFTLLLLANEFLSTGRGTAEWGMQDELANSRRMVDAAVRAGMEAEFAEFGPRLRLAQIVLTMVEGDIEQAANELRSLSSLHKDDGSCVKGFTRAGIKYVEAELAYRSDESEGLGRHAKAAKFAFRLKDRGEYCAREAHKLSAAYYILLAEEYARQGNEDEAIETFMKAIAAAHNDIDPSVEERVMHLVAVSIEAGFPVLATDLRLRADKIGAYENRTEEEFITEVLVLRVIYGFDDEILDDEDRSIMVVYLINTFTDRYRIFSRQR